MNKGTTYFFGKLFLKYKEINVNLLSQFTIGKNGIVPIKTNSTYSTKSHIVFKENSLVVGLGIDEIDVSIGQSGCCSPVYNTFLINQDLADPVYLKFFIKDLFHKQLGRITKKSTRRDFEIDISALNMTKFQIPILSIQKEVSYRFKKIYKMLHSYEVIFSNLTMTKKCLLDKLFI